MLELDSVLEKETAEDENDAIAAEIVNLLASYELNYGEAVHAMETAAQLLVQRSQVH